MSGIIKLAVIHGDQVTWAEVHDSTVAKVVVSAVLTVHGRIYTDGIDYLNAFIAKCSGLGAITPGLSTERLCVRLPVVEVHVQSRRIFMDTCESGGRREFLPNC